MTREDSENQPRARESSGTLIIGRQTAWMVAILIAVLLAGTVWIAAVLVTALHQVAHLRQQVESLSESFDHEKSRRIDLETQMVKTEAALEAIREGRKR